MIFLISDSISKFGFVLSRGSLLMPVVSDNPKWFSMTVDGSDAGGLTLHKVPIHRIKLAVGTLGTTEGPRVAKRLVRCLGRVWKTF